MALYVVLRMLAFRGTPTIKTASRDAAFYGVNLSNGNWE